MKLRPYQTELANKGLTILKELGLVYFALQPRVGKTLISLQVAQDYGAKKVLFVTKKKAMSSILEDFNAMPFTFKLTLINFESVHKVEKDFDLVIIDEAHSISAYPKASKRAKDLKLITYDLPIIYLSATPTPESFSQIFHQFWISSRTPFAKYTSFYKWAREFVFVEQRKLAHNMVCNDYSKANEKLIKEYTNKYFINYTQQDAGFTSFIDEKVLVCKMPESIWSLAKLIKQNKLYNFKNSDDLILADTSVKEQSKIHQISSGTIITENKEKIILSDAKAKFIKETFKGQKIAIYYKFDAERIMLENTFDNITKIPEDFNKSNDLIFISQFVSGREGVNIATADALIFMNIDFSSLSYIQSKARIQTKDRTKESKLYWIFSDKGIERLIYKAVIKKQNFTNNYYKKQCDEIGKTSSEGTNQGANQTRLFCN